MISTAAADRTEDRTEDPSGCAGDPPHPADAARDETTYVARLAFGLALALACAGRANAQWRVDVPETAKPPTIDGVLRPGEWAEAVVVGDFTQTDPVEGAAPTEKTEIYLLVDADNLYLGIRCHDSAPTEIVASQMTRDADLDPDDRIELVIDTFLDKRNAYFFEINAVGSKGDALIASNGDFFAKDWDGIWEGKATIDDGGWSAELAIPAKTLSMRDVHDAFGFNVLREIKRKNETVKWAYPDRANRLFTLSSAGVVAGMKPLDTGAGIDFTPFVVARTRHDHRADSDESEFKPGFDLRWRVTPSLTGVFTVNTDFADVEVDERVVNLTRFPVFFPEKRPFFLEDAGIFAVGGLKKSLLPFFSRRIGLSAAGAPVPILAGLKATGRIGDLNVGLLDVQIDSFDGVDSKNLAVGRASLNILEQSQVGVIFTAGDPATGGSNALAGLDFTFRTKEFLGRDNFRIDAYALGTFDEPAGGAMSEGGLAWGAAATYPNDLVDADVGYREISEDFRPDLGFVSRTGVRRLFGHVDVRPRIGGDVRRLVFGVKPDAFWSLETGELESFFAEVKLVEVQLESEDRLRLDLKPSFERLTEPFDIADGVTLPTGDYDFTRFGAEIETSDRRFVAGMLRYEIGSFYDGTESTAEADVTFRLPPSVALTLGYERNDVDLDEGSFATNLARARLRVDFSPDVTWSTLVQYDDVSDTAGINARLRWILEPGRDLSFVVNRGSSTQGDDGRFRLVPVSTEFTIKVALTFRF